jgi:hypothetical protein
MLRRMCRARGSRTCPTRSVFAGGCCQCIDYVGEERELSIEIHPSASIVFSVPSKLLIRRLPAT